MGLCDIPQHLLDHSKLYELRCMLSCISGKSNLKASIGHYNAFAKKTPRAVSRPYGPDSSTTVRARNAGGMTIAVDLDIRNTFYTIRWVISAALERMQFPLYLWKIAGSYLRDCPGGPETAEITCAVPGN